MDNLVSYASSEEEHDDVTQTFANVDSPPFIGPLPESQVDSFRENDGNNSPPLSPLSQERVLVRQLALPPLSGDTISNYGLVLDSPPGSPNPALDAKLDHFRLLKQHGTHFNLTLAQSTNFRNPRLLTTLVDFVGVKDQYGTCFPTQVWDPHAFSEEAYADNIAKAQAAEEERKARAQAERTKIEFETAKQSSQKSAAERVMEGLQSGSSRSRGRWDDRGRQRSNHYDRRRSRSPLPHRI